MSLPNTITGYLTGAMDPDEAVVLEAQAAVEPDPQAQIDAQREAAPRRGRAPKLLRVACPTCGAGVGAYCRSSTGKVLTNGHRARREAAGLEAAKSGPGSSARPQTDSADELVSAIKRAAMVGRGIRLSSAECRMLADAIAQQEKALQGALTPHAVSGVANAPATPPDAISAPMATMGLLLTALQGAVELHDAQNRGVVLTLSRSTHPRSAIPLLRQAGWTVCPYDVADGTALPTTDQFWADLAVADVVLVQGYSAADVATLAGTERFRHTLGPGAAVVLFTPDSRSIFYDQRAWGDGDQSVTVPATAEAAVRSAVARRRHIQALQGVRPGGLADARKALVG